MGEAQSGSAVLGRGRWGVVIIDKEDTSLAVKVLDVEDQRPPHNWKAELAALQHPMLRSSPHIISLNGIELPNMNSFEPQLRIRMPRARGTLENIIYGHAKARFPVGSGWTNSMPKSVVQQIVTGIAQALEAVHGAGIIHRDVKPENILFFEDPGSDHLHPVLADFGIAWVENSSEPPDEKYCDVSTGLYKAPELLYGVTQYTSAVDMWSLGCIFARLLGPDCQPLFHPYTSDLGLISAQIEALGSPNVCDCPCLAGTVADRLPSTGAKIPLKLPQPFLPIVMQLLDYNFTRRLTASQLVQELGTMCA